jgi:predicted nuclease of restriction endonuclease-like (RecB) superfamily
MKIKATSTPPIDGIFHQELFNDIVQMIQEGRHRVASEVNSTVVLLYWSIGKRINDEVLAAKRAEYGDQIIDNVAKQLTLQFGKGYSRSALFRMVRFAKFYSDDQIVATVSRQLSWSHVVVLCQLEQELQRDFYLQMCCIEKWSVRMLRDKIRLMLFERTAISKKPENVIKRELEQLKATQQLTPDLVFKDPCFLDFIGLDSKYSETDLEDAILDHIVEFIQELGNDFCFLARQKRMSTRAKDRYLDLLFFHRGLRRLIALDLKLDRFEPEHKGQMEWYLRWLDKNERKAEEGKPIGIILCAGKDHEDVEYMELDQAGIHVSEYLTELPPKSVLEAKLHKAIANAKQRHEALQLSKEDAS